MDPQDDRVGWRVLGSSMPVLDESLPILQEEAPHFEDGEKICATRKSKRRGSLTQLTVKSQTSIKKLPLELKPRAQRKKLSQLDDEAWTKKRRRKSQVVEDEKQISFRPSFLNRRDDDRVITSRRKRRKTVSALPLVEELRSVRFKTTAAGARLRSGEFAMSERRTSILDPRTHATVALDLDILGLDFARVDPNHRVFAVCLRRLSRLRPPSLPSSPTLLSNALSIDHLVAETESPLQLPASAFLLASASFKEGDTIRIYDPFLAPHAKVPILSVRDPPLLTVLDAQLYEVYNPSMHEKDQCWPLPPVPCHIHRWAHRLLSAASAPDSSALLQQNDSSQLSSSSPPPLGQDENFLLSQLLPAD